MKKVVMVVVNDDKKKHFIRYLRMRRATSGSKFFVKQTTHSAILPAAVELCKTMCYDFMMI